MSIYGPSSGSRLCLAGLRVFGLSSRHTNPLFYFTFLLNSNLNWIGVSTPDGYTVSDVVMYWKPTPVRGVSEAELPQFTIIGYETNDRKVYFNRQINRKKMFGKFMFSDKISLTLSLLFLYS